MNVEIVDGCISCGFCANSCPEVFQMGDDGLAEVYGDAAADPDGVKEAAEGCPVSVIIVK